MTKNKVKNSINKISFSKLNEIIKNNEHNNQLMFIEFTTSWCNDCKMMKPVIDEVLKDYENNNQVVFYEVDAEEAGIFRDPLSRWKIYRVPAFIYFKNNNIQKILYEYYPKNIIEKYIEDFTE
ncbi:thioredoxin family protein [Mycoplasmopsis meleagridis]|uniref:thioredoxin family protein n=1 Tax=Mycoplasmopsis meleagridis TaxID=29561 RepID=UPI003A8BFB52